MKMDRTLIERPTGPPPERTKAGGGGGSGGNAGGYGQGGGGGPVSPGGGGGGTVAASASSSDVGSARAASAGPTDAEGTAGEIGGGGGNAGGVGASSDPQGSLVPRHYRRLIEFVTEDPHVYNQREIQDMLDMIHDGNRSVSSAAAASQQQQQQQQHRLAGGGPHEQQHPAGADGGGAGGGGAGGLKPIAKAYGIVGFVRFLDCYYLTLITKRAKVGSIGGNAIYSIKSTETFPLKPAERSPASASASDNSGTDPSSMLLSMWNRGKRSVGLGLTNREIAELRYQGLYQVVDLTKNFFFSYTYDITRSLQENFLAMSSQPFPPPPFKDMYAWNYFLTKELEECASTLTGYHWVLPIVHGAFVQRKLNDYGRSLNLILLARRSRHFAGTRYLKRGVSDRGKVANDVEHEQICHDETTSASSGTFSSFLQVRGSIPTYWTQESSVTMPKPPIELNRVDPTYQATRAHFEDLLRRYGSPVVVVDLVKQSEKREREVRVGNEYRHAIDHINTSIDVDHRIRYCALDYSHISKHRNLNVSTSLNDVATWAVNQTGFFCSAPRWKIVGKGGRVEPFDESRAELLARHLGVPVFPMEQKGVLRTNCIDCLDRTNVAQFSAGVDALGQQLVVMGIRSTAKLDPSSNIVRMLIDMYVEIGDHIALQYGGSEAHKKGATAGMSNIQGPMGKHKELLTSIRRYYSNAFTDRLKQDAMNLFLGYYIPSRHTVPLWEMESDYYLHNFHVEDGRGSLQSMKAYQRTFVVDWSDDEDDEENAADATASPSISRRNIKRPTRASIHSNDGRNEGKFAEHIEDEDDVNGESRRIARVRKRCKAQNDALSVWWRVAIQSYIQQRMWMQLGRSPTESLLPPRFERLYQPEKLAQFDKFFARSWATPTRLSHSAQHARSADDDTERETVYRKAASPSRTQSSFMFESSGADAARSDARGESGSDDEDDQDTSLSDFIGQHGFKAKTSPSLPLFLKLHESDECLSGSGSAKSPLGAPSKDPVKETLSEYESTLSYVGSLTQEKSPRQQYIDYAKYSQMPSSFSREFRSGAHEEFTKCLYETSLDSDDVEGIRKLAQSAHIGSKIQTGPYRGLSQNDSAIEVTTVIQEQFNALDKKRERGELRGGGGLPGVDANLRRRGVRSSGVKEAVMNGWDRFAKAERQYAEIIDTSSLGCKRSDLTSESSMRLYCSFFDESTPLSGLEMTYMLGERPSDTPSPSDSLSKRKGSTNCSPPPAVGTQHHKKHDSLSFASKAAQLGIDIPSGRDVLRQRPPSLFSPDRRPLRALVGFEQINEDLFARKDNKFMVFNGAGVDAWHGNEPITKVHGIEEDFLVGS